MARFHQKQIDIIMVEYVNPFSENVISNIDLVKLLS